MKLTDKEQEAYEFIKRYIDTHGYSPTTREISHSIGFSTQRTGSKYMEKLKKKGYINYTAGLGRTITINKLPTP